MICCIISQHLMLRLRHSQVILWNITTSFHGDPHGTLVRLLKYTEGDARGTTKHRIQQTPEAGYQKAKLLLERHYGDPH